VGCRNRLAIQPQKKHRWSPPGAQIKVRFDQKFSRISRAGRQRFRTTITPPSLTETKGFHEPMPPTKKINRLHPDATATRPGER
jgi:hypothetical protein